MPWPERVRKSHGLTYPTLVPRNSSIQLLLSSVHYYQLANISQVLVWSSMSHSSKLWSLANYQGSCQKPRLRVSHSEVQGAHWHWSGTEPLNWWDLMPIPGRWCQSQTELLDTRLESGGLESWLQVLVSTTQLNDTNTQRQRPDFCVAIGKNFCLAPEVCAWWGRHMKVWSQN